MKQDDKTGTVTTTIQEVAYYNMFFTEAIFELLAEKGALPARYRTLRSKGLEQGQFQILLSPIPTSV